MVWYEIGRRVWCVWCAVIVLFLRSFDPLLRSSSPFFLLLSLSRKTAVFALFSVGARIDHLLVDFLCMMY